MVGFVRWVSLVISGYCCVRWLILRLLCGGVVAGWALIVLVYEL